MGAYLVFHPNAKLRVLLYGRIVRMPAYGYLVIWFGLQLFYGSLAHSMDFSNVGWFAHIGGFTFGAAVAYLRKKSRPRTDQSA